MPDLIDDFVTTTFLIAYVIGAIIYGLVFIGKKPAYKFSLEVTSNVLFTVGCVALVWQWYAYYTVLKEENSHIVKLSL